MAILEEVGAPEYSEQLTHESAQRAVAALENVELPSWARAEVGELVDFLARRQF
jgi:geranylgeranyl pyrophosphate synthase